jgi:uncharacterized protein YPO0396
MKQLKRIILINWYLIEAAEIEIEGNTAFIGPNASGKSSILDAVQATLFGGHGRYLALNASANEKSRRTLRDYCLGVVRDPDQAESYTPDLRPRERAVSYVVLVFGDDRTQADTAVGLAMSAALEGNYFEIDGRFVAPQSSPGLADFIERHAGADQPISWKRMKDKLRQQCPQFQTFSTPESYVRKLCEVLSYDGTEHLEPIRFLRNFRNALTFAPIRDVTEFVRRYILEEDIINVQDLQRSLQTYRDIHEKIRQVNARLTSLRTLNQHYTRAERYARLAEQYDWLTEEVRFRALEEEITPRVAKIKRLDASLRELTDTIKALDDSAENLNRQIQEFKEQRAGLEVSARLGEIEAKRQTTETKLEHLREKVDNIRRRLDICRELSEEKALLPEELRAAGQAIRQLLPDADQGVLARVWPEDPRAVDRAIAALRPAVEAAVKDVNQRYEAALVTIGELERTLAKLRRDISRLEKGETPLSDTTHELISLLEAANIPATPLCDVVDVKDESWRDTIESYLGGHREALVVSPEQAREAVLIYRREGRHLFGCRVINTRQTESWLKRGERGSLATLIGTDNAHARAYLNRMLGRTQCVDTEDQLLQHERAATADGMLHANGSVTRLQRVESLLGRGGRERQLKVLQERFAQESARYSGLQHEKSQDERLLNNTLRPLARDLQEVPQLQTLTADQTRWYGQLADLKRQEEDLDKAAYDTLGEKIQALEQERREVLQSLSDKRQQEKDFGAAHASLSGELETLRGQLSECARLREEKGARPGLDKEEALQRIAKEDDLFSKDPQTLIDRIQERYKDNRQRCEGEQGRAREKLLEHARAFNERPAGEDESLWPAWVITTSNQLEETELAQYEESARRALDAAERAFRADFVGKLQANLERGHDAIQELNAHLKSRPFHGEIYHFRAKPDAEFDPIIRWIQTSTVEQRQSVGGLFDFDSGPDSPHASAIQRVRDMLTHNADQPGEAGWRRLADYRNYYVFDVEMKDEQGNKTALSYRLGKGSGGEHQSPFYVAIGAALAATYRMRKQPDGTLRCGIALAVFDEAFSKLDVRNATSALEFLKDLGMQVIVAAPDEKWGLLAEYMDTMVNVYRTGGAVDIDPQYLTPEARALLAKDNPLKAGAEARA